MDQDTIWRAVYLGLLIAVLGGYFVLENRGRLGRVAQQAAVWGLIFVGIAAGYGLWSDIRAQAPRQTVFADSGAVEVPRAPDGHYYLTLDIAGTLVRFLVDTGASEVVLTAQDARRVGIDPDSLNYLGQATTANGIVRTARVRLEDVRLGETVEPRLAASVTEGEMETSLLGMTYLGRFSRIEIAGDRLILTR